VGKTELCKALAEAMFDDEAAMVRVDMSEFMEKHSVSRLLGAPPGYVGYEEGGVLTEAVRRRPYCVILFDEMEKAHRDVFNVLLQVLDDGRLSDNQGHTVDFTNTVVVMTSNAVRTADGNPHKIQQELQQYFLPEFLNRIDETIVFKPLEKEQIVKITDLQLRKLEKQLEKQDITLTISTAAERKIAELGFDPQYGARPLKRVIQREIQNPLATQLLQTSEERRFPLTVKIDYKDGRFVFA
jgi:ATP-dependent Clp protease ATP-binding subunit ClpB